MPVKTRLLLMVVVIGLLATMIIWASFTTRQVVAGFQNRFNSVQVDSLRIADHLQASVVSLRNHLLSYVLHGEPSEWRQFRDESRALRGWIDEQKAAVRSPAEAEVLNRVDESYGIYLEKAAQAAAATQPVSSAAGYPALEESVDRSIMLLELGYQLAGAHRARMEDFLQGAERSVRRLQALVFGALATLLALGLWLSWIVYRELLRPLRSQLVEHNDRMDRMDRREKLAALGMLAAGVAHEVRNPLAAIKACLFLQQKRLTPQSAEWRDAENMGREISRLERIVKEVLEFARPAEPRLEPMEAEQPLRDVMELLKPQFAQTEVRMQLESGPAAMIRADREQIKQVLVNLVRNSLESIEGEGFITLRTRLDVSPPLGRVVILEVTDTGKGMPQEVQSRLFDPFFSTKATGTGLGLSIAALIVEKHGGQLVYQSTEEQGTTFGIVLPKVL